MFHTYSCCSTKIDRWGNSSHPTLGRNRRRCTVNPWGYTPRYKHTGPKDRPWCCQTMAARYTPRGIRDCHTSPCFPRNKSEGPGIALCRPAAVSLAAGPDTARSYRNRRPCHSDTTTVLPGNWSAPSETLIRPKPVLQSYNSPQPYWTPQLHANQCATALRLCSRLTPTDFAWTAANTAAGVLADKIAPPDLLRLSRYTGSGRCCHNSAARLRAAAARPRTPIPQPLIRPAAAAHRLR